MNLPSASMTNLQNTAKTTYKTDETITITNQEFVAALFGNPTGDTRPVIVSFAGNPKNVAKKSWSGKGVDFVSPLPTTMNNNYLTLSDYNPDETGQYRRTKSQFNALHAIMLDDIGTKVDREKLILPHGCSKLRPAIIRPDTFLLNPSMKLP